MTVRTIGVVVALALLGGCGEGAQAPAANQASAPVTIRNDFHEDMMRLDDLQRGAALRRAIRSSGESCDRVEASSFQQDHANLKMWNARCQGTAYAVFLAVNGEVQVRKCADLASLGLPACRSAEAPAEGA